MNVWMFNQYAVVPAIGGSTRHFDCAKRLPSYGWSAVVFSGTSRRRANGDIANTGARPYRLQMIDDVPFLWIRSTVYSSNDSRRILNMILFAWRAFRLGRRRRPNVEELASPDVVIGSSVHPLTAAAACLVAKRHRVPFVFELRDLWPQSLIEMGALSPRHPFAIALRWLEGWLARRAARVIVLSERAGDYLAERGVPRSKIHYIPNGVDLDRFDSQTERSPRGEDFTLMYLGAHGIANRLSIILEAAAILQRRGIQDIRFVFVGGGQDQAGIRRRAEEMGLEQVRFERGVPKEDVPETLARADAFLLTEANNVYGSSNKLSDYLAAERPIVFSTYAQHNIIPGCGPAVPPEDAQALADAILALRSLAPEARAEMAAAGRRFAEQNRSWDVLVQRMAELLDSMTSE